MLSSREMISLVDWTSLNVDDDGEKIQRLCSKAEKIGPAAVCFDPQFLPPHFKQNHKTRVAVVGQNFPREQNATISKQETLSALETGVDEVDMVVNLPLIARDEKEKAQDEIRSLAQECHRRGAVLKVIIESGLFEKTNKEMISTLSSLSIEAGADFIKTSTGKVPQGASIEAVELILKTIQQSKRPVGLKVSGGIKTYQQAMSYAVLTQQILGPDALTPDRFRIGASGLMDDLLNHRGLG